MLGFRLALLPVFLEWNVHLFLLLSLLLAPVTQAEVNHIDLPDGAIVVTHATRYYHTNPETIAVTNSLLTLAATAGHPIYALGQTAIADDPDWYTFRDDRLTHRFLSRAGEHDLYPRTETATFSLTAMGGYHSACLGWTLSELTSRFLDTNGSELTIRLPMRTVYTGFLFGADGQLKPHTPYDESILDDSIDGLNLNQATAAMDDLRWTDFLRVSLQIAVFDKAPMRRTDLASFEFQLLRDGRLLASFHGAPDGLHLSGKGSTRKIVRFNYTSE